MLWSIVEKRVPELKEQVDKWVDEKERALEHESPSVKSDTKESKLSRRVRELAEKERDRSDDLSS